MCDGILDISHISGPSGPGAQQGPLPAGYPGLRSGRHGDRARLLRLYPQLAVRPEYLPAAPRLPGRHSGHSDHRRQQVLDGPGKDIDCASTGSSNVGSHVIFALVADIYKYIYVYVPGTPIAHRIYLYQVHI